MPRRLTLPLILGALVLPPTEGAVIKNRFRVALLGQSALYA